MPIKHELMRTFPDYSLQVLYQDREGTLWIGTDDGIHLLRELTINLLTPRQGSLLDRVYSIFQDRGGAIWIGTWGGGVVKYESGRFIRYQKAEGLPTDQIPCTYEDRSGRLWVGTWEFDTTGVVSYLENGRFKIAQHSFLKLNVRAITEDQGNLWFGTDQGLVKLTNGTCTQYTTKDGLPDALIRFRLRTTPAMVWH